MKKVVILLIIISILLTAGCKTLKPRAVLYTKIEDNPIKDGESTKLILEARNIGKSEINGYFNITPENFELVSVNYEGQKEFKILPGESVQKNYELTGATQITKSGVTIKIDLLSLNNTKITDTRELVLYIEK